MKILLCAVKDRALETFQPPLSFRSEEEASRWFSDTINNPEHRSIYNNPDDFDLWIIGSIDDQTGIIQQPSPVYKLADGKQLRQPRPAPTPDYTALSEQITRLQQQVGQLAQLIADTRPQPPAPAPQVATGIFSKVFTKGA